MALASKTHPTTTTRRSSSVALSRIVSLVCIMAPLTACGSTKSPATSAPAPNIILYDENNFSSTSKFDLPIIDTAPAANLDISWTDIPRDLQCHPVNPQADIQNVSLARFPNKTIAQVYDTLTSGELKLGEDVDKYFEFPTKSQTTSTKLESLAEIGGLPKINIQQQYIESTEYTYLLIAAANTTPGVGSRSMVFLNPNAAFTNTTVNFPDGCGTLDFTADLHSLTKVAVPAQGPWVVDWSNVTRDSEGKEVIFPVYDYVDLFVGFYQGMSVTNVEERFFDIEIMPTKMWQIKNIPGKTRSKSLEFAVDEGGNAFTGFEPQDGVWAIALRCPDCQNPTPMVLTIIDPIGGDQ